jgi:hypothetical protein
MNLNPYESPQHATTNHAGSKVVRLKASALPVILSLPFGLAGIYCFWTAWEYVGTAATADHPYIPGYTTAGAVFLTVAASVYVVARIAVEFNRPR